MRGYYLSRVLLGVCLFLALHASLWAAVGHSSLLPVLLWALLGGASYLICPNSPELAEVTE